jgi:hypothetical protein
MKKKEYLTSRNHSRLRGFCNALVDGRWSFGDRRP